MGRRAGASVHAVPERTHRRARTRRWPRAGRPSRSPPPRSCGSRGSDRTCHGRGGRARKLGGCEACESEVRGAVGSLWYGATRARERRSHLTPGSLRTVRRSSWRSPFVPARGGRRANTRRSGEGDERRGVRCASTTQRAARRPWCALRLPVPQPTALGWRLRKLAQPQLAASSAARQPGVVRGSPCPVRPSSRAPYSAHRLRRRVHRVAPSITRRERASPLFGRTTSRNASVREPLEVRHTRVLFSNSLVLYGSIDSLKW